MIGFIENRWIASILVGVFLCVPFCLATGLSHPPTFEQIKNASTGENCDPSAVYDALQYTDSDERDLTAQGDAAFIIGVAYQYGKPMAVSLLKQFMPLIENSPIGLSLLISCAFQSDPVHSNKYNGQEIF